MQLNGVGATQVSQVRGYADQRLRNLKDATDPSNRRISLIVQYIETNTDEPDEPDETPGSKPSGGAATDPKKG
jgi:chemotaxis protein MotB